METEGRYTLVGGLVLAVLGSQAGAAGGPITTTHPSASTVTLGQSVDGALDQGDTLRTLFRDYLSGDKSLPDDLRQVLSRPAIDPQGVQSLTVTALLASLLPGADGGARKKIEELMARAKELGIDNLAAR